MFSKYGLTSTDFWNDMMSVEDRSSVFLLELFMTQLALRAILDNQLFSYWACALFPGAVLLVLFHLKQYERILVVAVLARTVEKV